MESIGVRKNAFGRPNIQTIEWEMMDKYKFYPLSMLSSFSVRCFMYPFTVIKTRIQIQKHAESYKGTYDAFQKIVHAEGAAGLYRGFWVSAFQIVSGIFYITTYETVRSLLYQNGIVFDSRLRALIGGATASLVGQTIIVPFDVISQHLMVLGQKEGKTTLNSLNIDFEGKKKSHITSAIIRELYHRDGLKGFYRGYLASICAYVPNSALWWTLYHFYQEQISRIAPYGTSALLVQCTAAPLGGLTTAILTNPLDIIRARLQVQRSGGIKETFHVLWEEERFGIFRKGLSPRIIQTVVFSFMVVLGYESVKRFSVHDQYKDEISW